MRSEMTHTNSILAEDHSDDVEKYSRGGRGAPAKGVGRVKAARGFKSLFLR